MSTRLLQVLISAALLATSTTALAEGNWEVINKEEGITVLQKEVPDRGLPIFQGRAVIKANLYEVLGVLQDLSRHHEWMHACREAKLLKRIDDLNLIHYNRTKAPWPVSDRDIVLRSSVKIIKEKKTVLISFRGVKSKLKGEVDGVVRMPRLKGYYMLTALGPKKTRVQYQVDADPGGLLPEWVAKMASEEIPLNTLRNLRRQVKAVKGQYADFIEKWNPEKNEKSFALE